MKYVLVFCLFLAVFTCHAQYDSALRYRLTSPAFNTAVDTLVARAMADPGDTGEASKANTLMKYTNYMGQRISLNVPLGADMTYPMDRALSYYRLHYSDFCNPSGYSGDWKCLGPFTDQYNQFEQQGRIDAIWVNPNDTSCILVGANGGGLWKSNNGGREWRNITDGAVSGASRVLGMGGVKGIAVNPLDTNIIYISSGGREEAKKTYGYSLGLLYTTDGGTHWYSDTAFNNLVSTTHIATVSKIAFMPGTEKLFAISECKVLYKADAGSAWQDITPSSFIAGTRWCMDMEFTKYATGKVAVSFSRIGDTSYIAVYNPATLSWSYTPLCPSTPYIQCSPYQFALTGQDTAYIWFTGKISGAGDASMLVKTPLSVYNGSSNKPGG